MRGERVQQQAERVAGERHVGVEEQDRRPARSLAQQLPGDRLADATGTERASPRAAACGGSRRGVGIDLRQRRAARRARRRAGRAAPRSSGRRSVQADEDLEDVRLRLRAACQLAQAASSVRPERGLVGPTRDGEGDARRRSYGRAQTGAHDPTVGRGRRRPADDRGQRRLHAELARRERAERPQLRRPAARARRSASRPSRPRPRGRCRSAAARSRSRRAPRAPPAPGWCARRAAPRGSTGPCPRRRRSSAGSKPPSWRNRSRRTATKVPYTHSTRCGSAAGARGEPPERGVEEEVPHRPEARRRRLPAPCPVDQTAARDARPGRAGAACRPASGPRPAARGRRDSGTPARRRGRAPPRDSPPPRSRGWRRSRSRVEPRKRGAHRAALPSVEALSTTITSQPRRASSARLATHVASASPAFQLTMTTDSPTHPPSSLQTVENRVAGERPRDCRAPARPGVERSAPRAIRRARAPLPAAPPDRALLGRARRWALSGSSPRSAAHLPAAPGGRRDERVRHRAGCAPASSAAPQRHRSTPTCSA